jgi:hypothetical protein
VLYGLGCRTDPLRWAPRHIEDAVRTRMARTAKRRDLLENFVLVWLEATGGACGVTEYCCEEGDPLHSSHPMWAGFSSIPLFEAAPLGLGVEYKAELATAGLVCLDDLRSHGEQGAGARFLSFDEAATRWPLLGSGVGVRRAFEDTVRTLRLLGGAAVPLRHAGPFRRPDCWGSRQTTLDAMWSAPRDRTTRPNVVPGTEATPLRLATGKLREWGASVRRKLRTAGPRSSIKRLDTLLQGCFDGRAVPTGLVRYPHGHDGRAASRSSSSIVACLPAGRIRRVGMTEKADAATAVWGLRTHLRVDSEGYISHDGVSVRSPEAVASRLAFSPVASLLARARVALGTDVPVYLDASRRSAADIAKMRDRTFVCMRQTTAALARLLQVEAARGITSAWAVDGSVRPGSEDTPGTASFACCSHTGVVFGSGVEYTVPVCTDSSVSRAVSSYDAEAMAQVAVLEADNSPSLLVVFDATSPLDSAFSFAGAHERKRADLFMDDVLAVWTKSWVGRRVTYVHLRAHQGITANEWADVSAKTYLGSNITWTLRTATRPHASARLVFPEAAGMFSSGKTAVRCWATASLQKSVISRLKQGSTDTLRASDDDVTPSIAPASLASLTLVAVASRRAFTGDSKRTRGALLAYTLRESCGCGATGCDYRHYFLRCSQLENQRLALTQAVEAGAAHMSAALEPCAEAWAVALDLLRDKEETLAPAALDVFLRVVAVGSKVNSERGSRAAAQPHVDNVAQATLALVRAATVLDAKLASLAGSALRDDRARLFATTGKSGAFYMGGAHSVRAAAP